MGDTITHSVGSHGRNHRHDVTTIQMLLNNHGPAIWGGSRLSVDGVCGPQTIHAIEGYQKNEMRMAHADGLIFPTGATLRRLLAVASVKNIALVKQVHQIQKMQSPGHGPVPNVDQVAPKPKVANAVTGGAPSPPSGHKYTSSPLEMSVTKTVVNPLQLPDLLKKAWPELTTAGARLITAQYMGETGKGSYCWNYNLGNVKSDPDSHLHQYLSNTWEYLSENAAQDKVRADANARLATPSEIRKRVPKTGMPTGQTIVMFKPPDIFSCFRAYKSLSDGVVGWTDYFKKLTNKHLGLLLEVNKGNATVFVEALVKAHYFTAPSSSYLDTVRKYQKDLDSSLGAK